MAAQFQFVMRSGPNAGQVYPLEDAEIIIGRDASNSVAINDPEVSRKHAKLTRTGSVYVIQDLGSTNGTFVNGQRLTGTQGLNPGDTISFGENIVLMYEQTYDPNATVASGQAPKTVAPVYKPVQSSGSGLTPAPTPAPIPAYSGKVPAGPVPVTPAPVKKKKFPIWLIILIIFLLVICACIGFFLVIDQFNLWCKVLPFLVPFLGGSCG